MSIFVISDIHGMYKQFEQLLTYWNPKDKLILLGDLVDRGPQSFEVVKKVMSLKEAYGDQIIFCKGNHEDLLLEYIRFPQINRSIYFQNGGRETMTSFLQDVPKEVKELNPIEQAFYVKEQFTEELAFLENSKPYVIIGDVLFTHAGFESYYADFSESNEDDFLWIRDHYLQLNTTPYVNVFGHTPTRQIHKGDDIWVSEDGKYIGIDGGCVFGGQLNALLITQEGKIVDQYCVDNGAAKRKEKMAAQEHYFLNQTFEGILLNIQQKLNLSNVEMTHRLEVDERYLEYLLNGKLIADRVMYQQVYDLFVDTLSVDQKSYFLNQLKEPEHKLSEEDIFKLLKGENIDF